MGAPALPPQFREQVEPPRQQYREPTAPPPQYQDSQPRPGLAKRVGAKVEVVGDVRSCVGSGSGGGPGSGSGGLERRQRRSDSETLTLAQRTQQAPVPPARPSAAPSTPQAQQQQQQHHQQQAPAAPAVPQRSERIVQDAWTINCVQMKTTDPKKTCSAVLQVVEQQNRRVVFAWVIGRTPEGAMTAVFQTPTRVMLQKGVELKLGNAAAHRANFVVCSNQGCEASLPMDDYGYSGGHGRGQRQRRRDHYPCRRTGREFHHADQRHRQGAGCHRPLSRHAAGRARLAAPDHSTMGLAGAAPASPPAAAARFPAASAKANCGFHFRHIGADAHARSAAVGARAVSARGDQPRHGRGWRGARPACSAKVSSSRIPAGPAGLRRGGAAAARPRRDRRSISRRRRRLRLCRLCNRRPRHRGEHSRGDRIHAPAALRATRPARSWSATPLAPGARWRSPAAIRISWKA